MKLLVFHSFQYGPNMSGALLGKKHGTDQCRFAGRNCPICRAALKSIEGIRLLRAWDPSERAVVCAIPEHDL